MHPVVRHKKFWTTALCVLMAGIFVLSTVCPVIAEQSAEEKARQRMLNLEAANALWRLKRALKEDAYYSGRVRLNVWRKTAIDAGKFDPAQYEEFKMQLYEKSLNDSMKCIEYYIAKNNTYDANRCLQTWKVHAKEIDRFDETTYQEFVKRLNRLKENQAD